MTLANEKMKKETSAKLKKKTRKEKKQEEKL